MSADNRTGLFRRQAGLAAAAVTLLLTGCGGGSGGGGGSEAVVEAPPSSYTVAGTLTGLMPGTELVARDVTPGSSLPSLTLTENGRFQFDGLLYPNESYDIELLASNPAVSDGENRTQSPVMQRCVLQGMSAEGVAKGDADALGDLQIHCSALFFLFDNQGLPIVSDGTPEGTRSLNVKEEFFSGFFLSEGGVLFVTTGSNERHLWFSDGTPFGTHRVAGKNGELLDQLGWSWQTVGNRFYFTNNGLLWVAQGGSAMKVEGPEPGGVVTSGFDGMASAGDWLYVVSDNQVLAIDESGQYDVLMGSDEQPFNASSCGMSSTGDQLYFTCYQGSSKEGSWRVDAGESTARKISSNYSFNNFHAVGALTFFSGYLPAYGRNLWVTDGTESGTFLFFTPNPDSAGSNPTDFRVKGNALFFLATDGVANKIWKFSVVGKTVSLSGPVGSGVESLALHGDSVFFTAEESPGKPQVWVSDGTPGGTYVVKTINPNGAARPYALESVGDWLFFSAEQDDNGYAAWRTDGTEAGTVMLSPEQCEYGAEVWAKVGDAVYYVMFNDEGHSLWKTDGTAQNTTKIAEW